MLAALIPLLATAAAAAMPPSHTPCVDTVLTFVAQQNELLASRPLSTTTPPVFHLHVPRTAGRTLHGCLLTPGTAAHDRCPRAYGPGGGDRAAAVECGLLASHDDASLLAALPRGTIVVAHLRHPLARVLSSYEFATEGAALAAAGKVRATADGGKGRGTAAPAATPVAVVWPWSYLVPWLEGLMKQGQCGVDAKCGGGGRGDATSTTSTPTLRPPLTLSEFVDSPAVHDLVHNGAVLQVLGATNASRAAGAAAVRHCILTDAAAAAVAADAAADRLRGWVAAGGHVGLADRLDASVEAAATALGWSLNAPALIKRKQTSLGDAYRACEARTKARAARRRARAAAVLGGVPPLGAAGRASLPADVKNRILKLNAADVKLYDVAGQLLDGAAVAERLPPAGGASLDRDDRDEL